jgi:hypothetical protein
MTRTITQLSCAATALLPLLAAACATDDDYQDEELVGASYAGIAPLRGVISNLDRTPDVGVQICADRLDRHLASLGQAQVCATTGADGRYVLELRAFSRYELFLTKPGQTPISTLFRTNGLATEFFASMIDDAIVPVLFQLAGDVYDPTKGFVLADAYTRDVEDGTEPPPGPEVTHVLAGMAFALVDTAITPVYLNDQNLPDRSLTATSAAGVAVFGNIEPGDHDGVITSKPAGVGPCWREHRPIGAQPRTERVRVRAGTMGSFWFRCAGAE